MAAQKIAGLALGRIDQGQPGGAAKHKADSKDDQGLPRRDGAPLSVDCQRTSPRPRACTTSQAHKETTEAHVTAQRAPAPPHMQKIGRGTFRY